MTRGVRNTRYARATSPPTAELSAAALGEAVVRLLSFLSEPGGLLFVLEDLRRALDREGTLGDLPRLKRGATTGGALNFSAAGHRLSKH